MLIKINPDSIIANNKLQEIHNNNGCCVTDGTPTNTKCMCKYFVENQKSGYCPNNLYFKE